MSSIYESAEDSYLLSSVLKKEIPKLVKENSELKFLEVGSGSGIQLGTLFSLGIKKENIFSCDINPKAVEHCKNLGFQCFESNLLEKVKGKFNLIIFNPPYLPKDEREPENSRRETTGGREGGEIAIEFLKQAKNYLLKDGKIFLVESSLAEKINFEDLGFESKKISSKKLFFEELAVWELK
jgi:release factor glutamine methyltransferase